MELVPGGSLNQVTKDELGKNNITGTSDKLDHVHQYFIRVASAVMDQKLMKYVETW